MKHEKASEREVVDDENAHTMKGSTLLSWPGV